MGLLPIPAGPRADRAAKTPDGERPTKKSGKSRTEDTGAARIVSRSRAG